MANDTASGRSSSSMGPITRSATESLSKKASLTPSPTRNRNSELLDKRTPPTHAAFISKSENHKKMKMTSTPSPLRRSERTKNLSSSPPSDPSPSSTSKSSGSNKHATAKQLAFEAKDASEDEENDAGTSSNLKVKKMDARTYRATFKKQNTDCHEESYRTDRSTPEDCNREGGKIDECFKGNGLNHKAVSKDVVLPYEDSKAKDMSADSSLRGPVEELLENNVTLGSSVPSNATTHETSGAPERVQSDCYGEEASQMLPCNATIHEARGSGAPERVQSDCLGEETSQMLASRNSDLNENLIRKCVGHEKGENLTSSKRKRTVVDKYSDISATLDDDDNCDLIVDAGSSRLCGDIVETSGSCSKRIRRISLSDVQRDRRKLINDVDQPSSKTNDEKLSARNKEGKSGDSVERTQGSNVETEKIRKQQRSLHLSLKPEMAKLCEILLLPDNVKSMVEICLEYTMNNYQICTEPVSILQAFQLSLCWIATSLLKHKLDLETSLMLAKRHLNFDCKKDVVDEIYSRLWDLKDNFLLLTGNSKVTGFPKASESSNRVSSNTEVTPEVELTNRDISKTKEIQKHKNQWRELLRMQREKKQELEKDIEKEADFLRRYRIERAAIRSCSPNDAMSKEKLKVFNSEFDKRIGELKRKHGVRLKDLETKQLEAKQKFRESWALVELLNLDVSKEIWTPHNASKTLLSGHVAEGKSFDNIVEAMTRNATGVGFSEAPNTNSSAVVSCSSLVELQTPIVKHASVNEMDIMALKDGPVSGNKCHVIAGNEYSQGNIISEHSNSGDQCSDGATGMADEGEGRENFSHKPPNDCGQDSVTLVLPSSNGGICSGETSYVPSGEVALAVHKTSSSNDDQVEIPSSRQGKLDGTILSEPVGLSTGVKANGSTDGVKIMDSLDSQSPEEHIPSVSTMCMLNCKNAAQIPEADDGNGSNNADTLNSPSSDENSKSPQELVHSLNVTCMPKCAISAEVYEDDDGNGLDNVVTLNSPLNDDRSADRNLLDREVHLEMPRTVNFTPSSMDQISGGAVNVSVLDSVLPRPCGPASPSNSPDANAIILLSQPSLEKQNPNGVSSSIPAGQNPVEVSETSHECATTSELNREAAVGMPGTVGSTDNPENATPLNSSSTDRISDGGPVLDEVLSSRPCSSSSPSNCRPATISLLNSPSLKQQFPDRVMSTITDGQIPVIVPESSQEAECQLTDSVVADKSTVPDHQEGVDRTVTENTLSQGTPVSRPVDVIEPFEQVQPLSSAESPPDQDTVEEMQNSLVSSPVNILPANQSNHVSMVMAPPEPVQRLPSPGFLPSNRDLSNLPLVTGIEDQVTNGDALSSQIPVAVIEVQNQVVERPASNLVVDSHSRQFVPPVLNSTFVSLVPGGVRIQSSDTRNLSTPGVINNHPIQTATQSASRIVPHFCHDPLGHELERIRKLTEQNMKNHEDMKLQLKCDFEKEFEELRRKYDIKLKEIEVEFQKTRKNLDKQLKTVYVNKILADLFKAKSEVKVCGTSGMKQDAGFLQQSLHLPRQQNATWLSLVANPSFCGPPPASLQSSYATPGSQTMVPPPIQATSNASGIFCGVPARLPHINSISSASVNLQAGGEVRAPAPHLQPYRPSSSAPPSSLSPVPLGMPPSHPAPSNSSASSASFSHWLPQPTHWSDPQRGHWPENAGGFPTPNLTALDMRVDANTQSSQAPSPDVVCLSDDD